MAVFGLGMIGIIASLLYKISGANVLGLDPVQNRCDFANTLGIRHLLSNPPDDQVAAVFSLTSQREVDISVDAVGDSRVIKNAILATKIYGEVILLGTPREEVIGNITELMNPIHKVYTMC